jgi:hypothetical protein
MLHFAIHAADDSAFGRPETTAESLGDKGASAVRPAQDDKWLILARNLLESLLAAACRNSASPSFAEAAVSRNMSNS